MTAVLRHRLWSPRLVRDVAGSASLSEAALALARSGVPVFPCRVGGKQPLAVHGFQSATTDLEQVASWWRAWPAANVAIPTGTSSGIDVVDVDVHSSGHGFAAFARARSAGLVAGWSWLVRTPSGGLHAYFVRRDEAGEQRCWQDAGSHVDFRGDGGYVVVPPSRGVESGGQPARYQLLALARHRTSPVDAAALRAFLSPQLIDAPSARNCGSTSSVERLVSWVSARSEGERNSGLFWAACRMAERGHPLSLAKSQLGDAARTAGLPEREALSTIRSAYRSTGPDPRPSPGTSGVTDPGVGR